MLLTCICTKFPPAIALQFLRIRHRRPFGPDPSPFGSPPERDVRPRFNPPFRHLRPPLPSHHATSALSFGLNLQPLPDCLTQPRLQPSGIRISRPATCASVFRHLPDCLMRPPRQPSGIRPAACATPHQPPALVREICNQVSNFSLRPTYREVTACGGTFPDTVTYLPGYTPLSAPLPLERRAPRRLDTFRKVEHF